MGTVACQNGSTYCEFDNVLSGLTTEKCVFFIVLVKKIKSKKFLNLNNNKKKILPKIRHTNIENSLFSQR